MPTQFLMLPPQNAKTREWGARLASELPELDVIVAEDRAQAERAIATAEAAFGTIPPELLRQAQRLEWLQAPQAAPPAGFYYPELIAHSVQITNFREIYNDHIGAHVMAFVLAFARGLQRYIPQQLRREWKKPAQNEGVVHLPEATALIVGVGGIGSEIARLCAAFGIRVLGVDERRRDTPPGVAELHRADELDVLLPQADFVILTVPHTPETEGFMNRARFREMKKTAFFINIGRGRTTRLDDLAAAVEVGRNRRRRARCVRGGAAARRPQIVDPARRVVDPAHRRLRPLPRRTPLRGNPRQLPSLPRRPTPAQPRRQGALVLRTQRANNFVSGSSWASLRDIESAYQLKAGCDNMILSSLAFG